MKKYIPLTIGLLTVGLLLVLTFSIGLAQNGKPADEAIQPDAVDEKVQNYIPVQGRLTDTSGNPLEGNHSITFRLYNTETGGTELCHDTNIVSVEHGLFNSEIWGNCQNAMNGEQLYLGIEVNSDGEMDPRQPIYAVPYAWSLRPGAVISASLGATPNVHLETWSETGRALRSYAMSETGTNYGVVGASRSPDGYGGYFYNNGGGTALFGDALSDSGGIGVRGESVVGSGLYGKSTSGIGLYADTGAASHNYGVFTNDNLYSFNYHTSGATMQVVKNGGSSTLEAGDVVVFSGVLAPTDPNDPPVILVSKATTADSTAVAGIVYSRYSMEQATLEGAVQPDEDLLIVIQGPARVKVSAATGSIQAGDLLSTSEVAGLAGRAPTVTIQGIPTSIPGTVFAKALETLESGEGWMYVFVTLQ